MAISPLPLFSGTPPNRAQDQSSFNTNMANWISYTTTFQPLYNTFATQANAIAVEASGYKDLALTYSNNSAASAAESAGSASIAITAVNFKGAYSGLSGALNVPASTFHNGQYWQLLENTANVASDVPGVSSKWALAVNSAGYTVISAPFTLTYPGRYFITNTGTVTIPTPVGVADGVAYVFATALDETPTLQTASNGIKWRNGLDDSILMTIQAIELIANSDKYEV